MSKSPRVVIEFLEILKNFLSLFLLLSFIQVNRQNRKTFVRDSSAISLSQKNIQIDLRSPAPNNTASTLAFENFVVKDARFDTTYMAIVNPLPFVDRTIKTAPAVPAKNLSGSLRLVKAQKTGNGILIKANTDLVPLAVNAKGYLAELPDGNIIQTPFTSVKILQQPVKLLPPASMASAGAGK